MEVSRSVMKLRIQFSKPCKLYGSMPCRQYEIHFDKFSSTTSADKVSKLVFLYTSWTSEFSQKCKIL